MTTNHESPVTRTSETITRDVTRTDAYRDGWRVGIDQPEHPAHVIDVGGHSAGWLAGYHAARAAVLTTVANTQHAASDDPGVDDPCDTSVHCDPRDPRVARAWSLARERESASLADLSPTPVPNPNALLHVIPTHPAPEPRTPAQLARTWDREADPASRTPERVDVALAHARERALLRSNLGFIA